MTLTLVNKVLNYAFSIREISLPRRQKLAFGEGLNKILSISCTIYNNGCVAVYKHVSNIPV